MSHKLIVLGARLNETVRDAIRLLGDFEHVSCNSINEVVGHLEAGAGGIVVSGTDNSDSLDVEKLNRSLAEEGELGANPNLYDKLEVFERRIVEACLRRNRNHRKNTAKALGISRVTLHNKMTKWRMLDGNPTWSDFS